jgi:hypothetical protein
LPPEHAKTERSVAAASGIGHQGLKSIGCVIDCRSAVKSAWNPVAVFLAPVVFAASAPVPVAVLLLPVVLLTSALLPMAALNPRTVLLCSALKAGGCIADISRVRKGCGITGRYGKAALCIAAQWRMRGWLCLAYPLLLLKSEPAPVALFRSAVVASTVPAPTPVFKLPCYRFSAKGNRPQC